MRIEDIVEAPFIPLSVILRAHAARRGDAIALADEATRLSWAAMDAMLDRVATALQREGVAANEPVAIAASNAVNTGLAFLGALRAGAVAAPFDEVRGVKGLSIVGKAGDPVLAAADGRVVYAGSGLRGYGSLVSVKHNSTVLTAYAHNQTLLVKEDQAVRRGQRIAEMGSSDADQVKLHFEIRRLGKPLDPARLLPAR